MKLYMQCMVGLCTCDTAWGWYQKYMVVQNTLYTKLPTNAVCTYVACVQAFFLPSSLSCIHLLRLSNRALYALALLGSTCASTLHVIGKCRSWCVQWTIYMKKIYSACPYLNTGAAMESMNPICCSGMKALSLSIISLGVLPKAFSYKGRRWVINHTESFIHVQAEVVQGSVQWLCAKTTLIHNCM